MTQSVEDMASELNMPTWKASKVMTRLIKSGLVAPPDGITPDAYINWLEATYPEPQYLEPDPPVQKLTKEERPKPYRQGRYYSTEFKVFVVQRILDGTKIKDISDETGVPRSVLNSWRLRFKEGGNEALKPIGRPRISDSFNAKRETET